MNMTGTVPKRRDDLRSKSAFARIIVDLQALQRRDSRAQAAGQLTMALARNAQVTALALDPRLPLPEQLPQLRNDSRLVWNSARTLGHFYDDVDSAYLLIFDSGLTGLNTPSLPTRAAHAAGSLVLVDISLGDRGVADDTGVARRHALRRSADIVVDVERPSSSDAAVAWDHAAARVLTTLANVPQRTASPRQPLPCVALVGPLPPARSGIADYNVRVIQELGQICNLHVFHPDVSPSIELVSALPAEVYPLTAFGPLFDPNSYHAIVYTVGNSPHHHESYAAMQRYPGWAWMHDVRMTSFFLSYAYRFEPDERQRFTQRLLEAQYDTRLPVAVANRDGYDTELFEHHDIFMTGGIADVSTGIIANSRYARHLLELDLGPNRSLGPVCELPFAIPAPARRDAGKRVPDLIVSPGFASPVKLPALLIQAFAQCNSRTAHRLAFVGETDRTLRDQLISIARELGVANRLIFTGYQDDANYRTWLERAACAVLVRRETQGESSAAAADCLAVGIPVVTNIPSCMDFDTSLLQHHADIPTVEDLAASIDAAITAKDPGNYAEAEELLRHHSFGRVARELLQTVLASPGMVGVHQTGRARSIDFKNGTCSTGKPRIQDQVQT